MSGVAARILVVEDEQEIRQLVALTLELEGFEVLTAANAMEAFEIAATSEPDLVLLDLMMPAISGLEVLQELRRRGPVPIIIVSALAAEENRVRGLQLGADDYVVKPFSDRELVARVQAVLRRARHTATAGATMTFGPLTIDVHAREVTVHGRLVDTTAKEFDLLAFLASNAGRVFTRHQLLREVWRSSSQWQQEGTVTEHVRRLRLKMEDDAERPRWLQTVRGVGYRFERRLREPAQDAVVQPVAVAS